VGIVLSILVPILWALAAYAHREQQFPVVWQYHTALDQYFVASLVSNKSLKRVPVKECGVPSNADAQALWVDTRQGEYSGISIGEPHADWRGFSKLEVDLVNPGRAPITLTLHVHDRWHKEEYSEGLGRQLSLSPGPLHWVVPVADIKRGPTDHGLDIANIAGISIFSGTTVDGASFCLSGIRLTL
jgi:hypothetical protein